MRIAERSVQVRETLIRIVTQAAITRMPSSAAVGARAKRSE
jgi:hypothetical protein